MERATEKIKTAAFVMVPVELVRSNASHNAILCFVAMGSFGPESRARVSSIGTRMRVVRKKIVREAQAELIQLGFLKMLEEAKEHSPREWALWPFNTQEGGTKWTPPKCDGHEKGLAQNVPPKQSNSNEADKRDESEEKPKGSCFSKLMAGFKEHGVSVTERLPKQIGILNARASKLDPGLFDAVVKAYCTDEFIIKQGRSINGFLNCLDRLADKVTATDARFKPKPLIKVNI